MAGGDRFPSTTDDNDNVIFEIAPGVKAICVHWQATSWFEGATQEQFHPLMDNYVKGLYFTVPRDYCTYEWFAVDRTSARLVMDALKEKFGHVEAIVSAEFLSTH